MSVEIQNIANVRREGDIWYSATQAPVSYPSEAHLIAARVEDGSFWFQHRNDLILDVVNRFGAGDLFLDIGGGRGYVSRALQQAGVATVLVEPDENATQIAHDRGIENVVCAAFQDAEFEPRIADAIGMFDVVEHIDDSVGFLSDAHSLLKPGGLLYATVPAYQWLWSDEDEYTGHFRRYTASTLTDELARAGFRVEYLTHAFSFLIAPIFAMRALPTRLGIKSTVDERSKSHTPSSFSNRVLTGLGHAEARRIAAGKTIPAGTTIVVVARKVEN